MKHPARYSDVILPLLAQHLQPGWRVLDPFAGTGRIHELVGVETVGVEIEPEWATMDPRTVVGNALRLDEHFEMGSFDAVCTSPCLAQHHRVLTEDLRWVPTGDIRVGDRLMAFEEHGQPGRTGRNARRRWQRAEVVRCVPRRVECVRVILANGDEVVTTPEHPWLVSRYSYGGIPGEWVSSSRLMGSAGVGRTKGHQRGARQPYYVSLQVAPWDPLRSYDAGWLAGMFDGEGSLSLGVHGSPKLVLCQVQGAVIDRAEDLMHSFGYAPNRIVRKPHGVWQPPHRQPIDNLYVTGGFPGIMRALGQLRPVRLMEKWAKLDVSTRTVEAEKVAVLAVEPAGLVDIQEIESDVGTYIGEGYLHHNCYGNRMADAHEARDASRRITYRHVLGRKLSPGSTAGLQFGPKYRQFHETAWWQVARVLAAPDRPRRFVLNTSNHIRAGREVEVTEWHHATLERFGFQLVCEHRVETPRMGFGANGSARVAYETVACFQGPAEWSPSVPGRLV